MIIFKLQANLSLILSKNWHTTMLMWLSEKKIDWHSSGKDVIMKAKTVKKMVIIGNNEDF